MVVNPVSESIVGHLSGGCVEAAVARLAMHTLEDGAPQRLVFGRGSPFFDIQLTCGGRVEIWLERIPPDDKATGLLIEGWQARQPMLWSVNLASGVRECCGLGDSQVCSGIDASGLRFELVSVPPPKLIIAGGDTVALALAELGIRTGWEIILHRPRGPDTLAKPWSAIQYHVSDANSLFAATPIDPWTAIVCTNHDLELDHAVLIHALRSPAFYVGVLGSRTKIPERHQRLQAAGLSLAQLERLHAPVGLPIGAQTPNEIAIAIMADLIRALHHG